MNRDDNNNSASGKSTLKIWQQNVNRSNITQQAMLETASEEEADIICIQEPYIDFKSQSRANAHWFTVYPPQANPAKQTVPRALTLVHSRLHTDSWSIIPLPSQDITAVQITHEQGEIVIINVYNDCKHDKSL
ncbi:Endonuclease/exonuclease/phosphatase, partial [Amylostereum chailletii]